MNVLLVSLFLAAVVGLAYVGYCAVQLKITVTRLETKLSAERELYDEDSRRWQSHSDKIKAQYQKLVQKHNEDAKRWRELLLAMKTEKDRLSKLKGVPNTPGKTAEMTPSVRARLEKATNDPGDTLAMGQQDATVNLTENDQKAPSQGAGSKENFSRQQR